MRRHTFLHGQIRNAAFASTVFCLLLAAMASSAATVTASTVSAGPMTITYDSEPILVYTCAYGLLDMYGDVAIVSMPTGSVLYVSGQNDDGWVLNQGSVYIANGVQTISVNSFFVSNARLHARIALRSIEVSQDGNGLISLYFSEGEC